MQSGEIITVLCYQCRWSFTKDYWSIVSLYEDNCYLQNQVINIICIVIDGLHLLKYFKLYKNDKKTTCTPPFTFHIIGQNEKLFLGGISKHAEKMPSNRYCLQIGQHLGTKDINGQEYMLWWPLLFFLGFFLYFLVSTGAKIYLDQFYIAKVHGWLSSGVGVVKDSKHWNCWAEEFSVPWSATSAKCSSTVPL